VTASASWFLKIGGAITGVFLLLVVAGPALAPYDPQAVVGASLVAPSGAHLLGTNDAGQDILSQLLVGTRASMLTGILAATLAVAAGVLVGATAGLLGGWADLVAMRIVDVFLAIPALPLVILIASLAGPSRATIVAVIALAGWPPTAVSCEARRSSWRAGDTCMRPGASTADGRMSFAVTSSPV